MELGSTLQPTNHEMAETADVSVKTIQQAKAAHAAGLGDQVRDGKLTAKKAAELVRPARPTAPTPPPQRQPEPAYESSPPQDEPQPDLPVTDGPQARPATPQRRRALLRAAAGCEDRDVAIEIQPAGYDSAYVARSIVGGIEGIKAENKRNRVKRAKR